MTYYWAAKAQRAGYDPYQLASLSWVAGKNIVLPYLYPPGVLYLIRPLTWLPLDVAIVVFVSLKLAGLVALLLLWLACLGKQEALPLLVLLVLGFSHAVLNDVFAGNVSTFEQLALWFGFLLLLRQRVVAFSILVVLASVAKVTPLGFLLLVLFTSHRRRFLIFACAGGAGLLSILASFGGSPTRMFNYFKLVGTYYERGPSNPTLFPLLLDVYQPLALRSRLAWLIAANATYGLAVIVLLGLTALVAIRIWRLRRDDRAAMLDYLMGIILVYAIALPRFKNYSYVLLIPAVVFVGRRIKNALPLLILLACLTNRNTFDLYALDGFPLTDLVSKYFNLVIAVVLWLAYVRYAWGRGSSSQEKVPDTGRIPSEASVGQP